MKLKSFTLDSGSEEGWRWRVDTKILNNGTFFAKGNIHIQNNKEQYQRVRKKWRFENTEHINELQREWRKNNPHYKEAAKRWAKSNPDEIRELDKRRYYRDRKKRLAAKKKWNQENPEKQNEQRRKWAENNIEKVKLSAIKKNNRRRRDLGFVLLNKKFGDSVAHHINKEEVVFIPESIHRRFQHNLNKPSKNLDIVNSVAYAEVFYAL